MLAERSGARRTRATPTPAIRTIGTGSPRWSAWWRRRAWRARRRWRATGTPGTTPPTARRTARPSRSKRAIFPIDGQRPFPAMLKIGISACFFHEDPKRPIFKGMTLQYIEQNVAHWLMQRDVLAFMVPSPEGRTQAHRQQGHGGRVRRRTRRARADGRLRRLPRIVRREGACGPNGTATASATTTRSRCCAPSWREQKPVLGVCRGAQVINVAPGGTLYQDIGTQLPRALNHRNWAIYEQNCHATSFVPGSGLARLYPGHDAGQDELDPPPGDEGPGPRPRRRGLVGAGSHRRGDCATPVRPTCSPCSGIRSSTRPTTRPSSTTRRSSTTFSPRPRSTRPRPSPSDQDSPMKITNPATGAVIADVAADGATAVRRKYAAARAGQVRHGPGCR